MKELTPMSELLSELYMTLESKLQYLLTDITDREEHKTHGEIFALNLSINAAKAKLPKEQAAIEEAYISGDNLMSFNISDKATEYFTSKYKSNE